MAEQKANKPRVTTKEQLEAAKRELAFGKQLAKEGKLSAYLKEMREAAAKDDPDWRVLVK